MGEEDLADSSSGKPREEKKKSKKSKSDKSKSSSKKSKKSSKSDDEAEDSTWDPKQFDEQTGERWKESDEPSRVQDLPSPTLAEAPPGQRRGDDDEEWPFKKECAMEEKRKSKGKRSGTSKKDKGPSMPRRDAGTEEEDEVPRKEKRSSKKKSKKKKSKSEDAGSDDDQIVDLKDEDDVDDAGGRRRSMKKGGSKRFKDADEQSDDAEAESDERDRESSEEAYSYRSTDEESDDVSYFSDDDENYSYDLDGSVHSYGSIEDEDLEDYDDERHSYYHTPGMLDYDEELVELMHKANPELTEHLNRRVHRRRDNVQFDQNMPMMTRQALMTRQASSQIMRGRVDADSIDRSRLGFRNESFHGRGPAQKPQRRGPGGRRAPPRSKSSGLGTMALASRGESSDDPRARFRSRGASTSFQRYNNKPNRVATPSRRGGDDPLSRSNRSSGGQREPRRGKVQRAKSSTALGRPISTEVSATKPERRGRRPMGGSRHGNESDSDVDSDEVSSEEDSDVETPITRRGKRPGREKPKPVNKRDMTVKRHRRKLHALIFQTRMGVEMQELIIEVQKGEIPKSPIKALLMDSP